MYKWKREEIIILIEMVEERVCLWDVSHPDYHNQIQRRNGLQDIASRLNIPVDEIKKKIHTLRAQHSKERLKMKTIKSGSGSSEVYKSKWEFFNLLEFMFRHTEKRNTVDSMVETDDHADSDDTSICAAQISNEHSSESQSSTNIQVPMEAFEKSSQSNEEGPLLIQKPCSQTFTPISRASSRKRKASDSSTHLNEQVALNRCMSILSESKPRDEFSIFGEYVASELRLLSDSPDIQFKLKYDIQQLIASASFQNASKKFALSPASSVIQIIDAPLTSPDWDNDTTE